MYPEVLHAVSAKKHIRLRHSGQKRTYGSYIRLHAPFSHTLPDMAFMRAPFVSGSRVSFCRCAIYHVQVSLSTGSGFICTLAAAAHWLVVRSLRAIGVGFSRYDQPLPACLLRSDCCLAWMLHRRAALAVYAHFPLVRQCVGHLLVSLCIFCSFRASSLLWRAGKTYAFSRPAPRLSASFRYCILPVPRTASLCRDLSLNRTAILVKKH